ARLFDGGTARLVVLRRQAKKATEEDEGDEERIEESDDAIAGIEIEATPPGKKFKSLSFLSGGEKALTAIALLCAILAQNPSPFVVLDEVDAALDEFNANRFASIIKDLSPQTQFILITHNRVTMHIASVLYGVTMGEGGMSSMLSLDMGKLDAIVKP
ncbi:MAG: AAA family ATPase, partial [Patescibacteria group bacterium]